MSVCALAGAVALNSFPRPAERGAHRAPALQRNATAKVRDPENHFCATCFRRGAAPFQLPTIFDRLST
jgi:hypothetical protein